MEEILVSIVIPNFNGAHLMKANLPSVLNAIDFAKISTEIIVSDDNSTDHSLEFLSENYPQIILIKSDKNTGFSTNVNRGIQSAKGKYVLLLNTDVRLHKEYFKYVLEDFSDDTIFGIGCRIMDYDDENKIQDGAKHPKPYWVTIKSTCNIIPIDENINILPTYFVSGACAMYCTAKLKALNGFEELFSPFYMEDEELSVRAWKMGWKCMYEHRAVCYHKLSSTILTYNKKKQIEILHHRNKSYFYYLHLQGIKLFFWWLKMLFSWIGFSIVLKRNFPLGFNMFLKTFDKINQRKKEWNLQLKNNQIQNDIFEIAHKIKTEQTKIKTKQF